MTSTADDLLSDLEPITHGPSNPLKKTYEDVPEAIPRDRWNRPLIVPAKYFNEQGEYIGSGKIDPKTGAHVEAKGDTRASGLGGVLEDSFGLGQWRMRMAIWGLVKRNALVLAVRSIVDPSGRDKSRLGEIADEALEAAETSAAATVGTAIHAITELWDRREPMPELGDYAETFEHYKRAIADVKIVAIETFVANDELETAGTFDRLVELPHDTTTPDGEILPAGTRLIYDLKTSSSDKYFGLKFAVQLAVYQGGEPYEIHDGQPVRPGWPDGITPHPKWGLILHLPGDGGNPTAKRASDRIEPVSWHWVRLDHGRTAARLAVTVKKWRQRKDLVIKHGIERAAPQPLGEMALVQQVKAAQSVDELIALWRQHRKSWTTAVNAIAEKRKAEIGG